MRPAAACSAPSRFLWSHWGDRNWTVIYRVRNKAERDWAHCLSGTQQIYMTHQPAITSHASRVFCAVKKGRWVFIGSSKYKTNPSSNGKQYSESQKEKKREMGSGERKKEGESESERERERERADIRQKVLKDSSVDVALLKNSSCHSSIDRIPFADETIWCRGGGDRRRPWKKQNSENKANHSRVYP